MANMDEKAKRNQYDVPTEETIGMSTLYAYGQGGAQVIEKPTPTYELNCGDLIYDAGRWGAMPNKLRDAYWISCFVTSNASQRTSALVVAKASQSIGDIFVDEHGHKIGVIKKIIRPVESAPGARVFDDTVFKNYVQAAEIEIEPNWRPKSEFRYIENERLEISSSTAEPQVSDAVFVLSAKHGLIRGVVTRLAVTKRVEDYWLADLFEVRLNSRLHKTSEEHYSGLVIQKNVSPNGLSAKPTGMIVRTEAPEILLCARMARILEDFNARLM